MYYIAIIVTCLYKEMSIKSTLEAKIRYRIRRSFASAFVYSDFADLSDRYQVWRVLKKMIDSGDLIRVGQGVYSRVRKSIYSGKIILKEI